jgi:hypothetical protein
MRYRAIILFTAFFLTFAAHSAVPEQGGTGISVAAEEFLYYDHPSGRNRIHQAMVWKAGNVNTTDIAAHDAAHHPPGE